MQKAMIKKAQAYMKIHTGLDVLVNENFKSLLNQRVAILANQASVSSSLEHILILAQRFGVTIVKLFAPEHGFSGNLQDMEHVEEGRHDRLNLPVISLYGDHKASLELNAQHLHDVDTLVCDLQDVGSRYYTFHCTISWAMKACSQTNTRLVIIDRPNPINAAVIEGNLIKEPQFSFVGAYPLPNRHGFTMGELVIYVKDNLQRNLDVDVIKMKNYDRTQYFDAFNLPFVYPSPNMPTVNTAVVYPGMCLIEGTNLSEGRGTCTPFELVGAPYIRDGQKFKEQIEHEFAGAGITLRSCTFTPKFHKWANQECAGVFIHVTDRSQFQPLRFAIALIKVAVSYNGFSWRHEPYEFETDRLAIDLLLGDIRLRTMLEKNAPLAEIFGVYEEDEQTFSEIRRKYLQY